MNAATYSEKAANLLERRGACLAFLPAEFASGEADDVVVGGYGRVGPIILILGMERTLSTLLRSCGRGGGISVGGLETCEVIWSGEAGESCLCGSGDEGIAGGGIYTPPSSSSDSISVGIGGYTRKVEVSCRNVLHSRTVSASSICIGS